MKYKIGDMVRVKSGMQVEKDYGGITLYKEMKKIEGKEVPVYDCSNVCYKLLVSKNRTYWFSEEMLEPVESKPNKLIILCPTKELYNEMMLLLEEKGMEWNDGEKPTKFFCWDEYQEGTAIRLYDGMIEYGPRDYYRRSPLHSIFTFVTAGEFLEKYATTSTTTREATISEIPFPAEYRLTYTLNKPKKSIMETLKNSVLKLTKTVETTIRRLSPEYRDLYRAGYLNGDLKETEKYDEKMMELLREDYRLKLTEIAETEIKEAEEEAKTAK